MIHEFQFATAGRILFGEGRVRELPALARAFGRRFVFVTGFRSPAVDDALESLNRDGGEGLAIDATGEPSVEGLASEIPRVRAFRPDVVIGFGGGSAIDTAKALAALAANGGDPLDYLEVIGGGRPLEHTPLPSIAVPTTSGTGAEVTANAVLASKAHRVKVSLRHTSMIPRVALVDPQLTWSVPAAVTAWTGLDALTQVIEPFVSNAANPLTDALCRDGIRRAARSLKRAVENGADRDARADMSFASLAGGLALANARLGAVHGFAGPVGGACEAPHGAVCARLLPLVFDANARAAAEGRGPADLPGRLDDVARLLTGRDDAAAADGSAWLRRLCEDLAIPGLSTWGVAPADIPALASAARKASSMKGNPVELSEVELTEILLESL